jgi:hypothetical protein
MPGSIKPQQIGGIVARGRMMPSPDIRPAGEPERLKVPLTMEGLADAAEAIFRERVEWWGG